MPLPLPQPQPPLLDVKLMPLLSPQNRAKRMIRYRILLLLQHSIIAASFKLFSGLSVSALPPLRFAPDTIIYSETGILVKRKIKKKSPFSEAAYHCSSEGKWAFRFTLRHRLPVLRCRLPAVQGLRFRCYFSGHNPTTRRE